MNKKFKPIIKKIKEYKNIIIARHQNSDLDCLGAQFALKEWINLNFKNKKVYCVGENHNKYTGRNFIPKSDTIDFENEKYLGVCVDVNQYHRVDNGEVLKNADYKICIDHHGGIPDEFDYTYIDSKVISCSQIIAEFMFSCKTKRMNKDICKYLFAGISADSGNFYYEACDSRTFEVGAKLLKEGKFNQYYDFHHLVGLDTLEDTKVKYELFNKIIYDKESGVAYYINTAEDLKRINVTPHGANEKIGSFNRIEEFEIVLAASEDSDGLYRCSIRSKEANVAEVATKFGGGGHKLACGVKGINKTQLEALISDLKSLKKNNKKN